MTILCGTDFTGPATEALVAAALIAAHTGERLELVHVTEVRDEWMPEGRLGSEDLARTPPRVQLATAAARARELGAHVEEQLIAGNAAEVLASKAASTDTRMIIVSSLGRRAPARWLLGSVAERLARSSSVPVLVVRDAGPFGAWVREERPLRVMVGADDSAAAGAALEWLHQLRRIGPCDVTVARIARPYMDQERIGLDAPVDYEHVHPDVERTLVRDLKVRLGQLEGKGELSFVVRQGFGYPERHLVKLAEELSVDLLVVGSHQRSAIGRLWHGSVSRGVLHLAPMSVASVAAPMGHAVRDRSIPAPVLQQVLVATDFSATGDRAVPWALSLLPNGGTLHLVHVLAPLAGRTPVTKLVAPHHETPEERARTEAEARAELRRLVPDDAARRGVDVTTEVLEGHVAEEICRAAERWGVDTICIGTHGRSGVAAAVMGSVARAVLAHSRRPVFVVGPGER